MVENNPKITKSKLKPKVMSVTVILFLVMLAFVIFAMEPFLLCSK